MDVLWSCRKMSSFAAKTHENIWKVMDSMSATYFQRIQKKKFFIVVTTVL